MKKKLLTTVIFIAFSHFYAISQNVVDFESLPVPESGYFNGSSEHSGTVGSTERFDFGDNGVIFRVFYTLENGYDYWSGTAYSNQTDLTTADWTNFSAYANYPDGGGHENSSNYAIGYMYNSDTIRFELPVCFTGHPEISGAYLTNSVWAYHYMNGTDGSGAGTYETGDYYKLIFKSLDVNSQYTGRSAEFYLADFTNGNSYIVDDWTWVDLSALGEIYGLEITYETNDSWTPSYYCMDNLIFDYVSGAKREKKDLFTIFPNPATNFVKILNIKEFDVSVSDISGKIIIEKFNCFDGIILPLINLSKGIYFINIKTENETVIKKIIKY